ncbi:MAG: heat-inducible transcriptional repressor HrcA [Bacteroidetes bacterium]|nr:heat-inducible transcriptional repressor HrcA [Bacteroidota bacterium]
MEDYILSDREKSILRSVIHQFILTANPVGSRNIAKKNDLGLSPATIRNIMADLEDSGFLNHPHTSAGRLPTDRGYRFYVDSLMDPPVIEETKKDFITAEMNSFYSETDDLLKLTASLLSELTSQLACVTFPKFENSILTSIQLVQLSSTRLLVVVSIKSGLVKTITLEVDTEISSENIIAVQKFLNEKLSGLTFTEIRKTLKERIQDIPKENYRPIVRVFLESVDKIFQDSHIQDKSYLTGAKNILSQPEFGGQDKFKGIIELIEDKDIIIHIMDKVKSSGNNVSIIIGEETMESKFSDFSMITKEYQVGGATGTVGIMGPKRMEYSRMIATVVYIAEQLSLGFKKISL